MTVAILGHVTDGHRPSAQTITLSGGISDARLAGGSRLRECKFLWWQCLNARAVPESPANPPRAPANAWQSCAAACAE